MSLEHVQEIIRKKYIWRLFYILVCVDTIIHSLTHSLNNQ